MSFFELFEQFWQLDAERTIAPSASKLYFYLLNEFNSARPVHWPSKIYRRATQVYADLGIDKKTLPSAVATLEERGLIRHYSGDISRSGEWHLNYGPAAEWAGSMGKNSPQQQPEEETLRGKIPHAISEMAEGMGKNSPPIRNRKDKKRKDHTPPASACVGEAAEEITPAPLPAENSQLVPPVAEPPHAAESRPVAAAELPAALLAEVKALADEMGKMWGFSELHGFPGWSRLYTFAKHQAQQGRLAALRQQLAGYQAGHMRPGVRAHKLADWLGDPQHAQGPYTDGVWCSCDWPTIANQVQARPGQPAPPPGRATASPSKAKANWQ
jgi:hypothetical protein